MSARGTRPRAARPAGTGARTPTASPPGARPAGPCRSGPAPARPPWRPSAARATTTDAGSVGLDVAPPPGRRLLVGPRFVLNRHGCANAQLAFLSRDMAEKERQNGAGGRLGPTGVRFYVTSE